MKKLIAHIMTVVDCNDYQAERILDIIKQIDSDAEHGEVYQLNMLIRLSFILVKQNERLSENEKRIELLEAKNQFNK